MSDSYVANVLYNEAIKEERKWRNKPQNRQDVLIINEILNDVRLLGYDYKYFADIANRKCSDKDILRLLMKYVGKFNDTYLSAQLVSKIGIKGNYDATEIILNDYAQLSYEDKNAHAVFYDNALSGIQDKRYIDKYLAILSNPQEAIRLSLTMIMLGKWQIEDAKKQFVQYILSPPNLKFYNSQISDLVFTSIEALSYYSDRDGTVNTIFQNLLTSGDKDIVLCVKKAITRLNKHKV